MNNSGEYYLTKEGLERFKKEYDNLIKLKRANLREEVPEFLHSEELNAEFVSFKEDSEYLETRVKELEHILNNFELIKPPAKKDRDTINLGAHVEVEANGAKSEIILVGTMEVDPMAGKVSNESPIGRALIRHKVGDMISISVPSKINYKIKKVKY